MRPPSLFASLVIGFFFFTTAAFPLTVNRVNGGASISYIDFSLPGAGAPLELQRTYNSITALNEVSGWPGAFGWGWTAPFESTLTTTPERHVILRDGGTGSTVLFRPVKEDPKAKEKFYDQVKKAFFEEKKKRKVTESELKKLALPTKMLNRLKTDLAFRTEIAARYNINSDIPKGELLVSSEYGYQTIQFKNGQWIRDKEGITQYFDKEGRLTLQVDKNNFSFEFKYQPIQKSKISEYSDRDRTNSLKFTWKDDHVIEIADNRGNKAKYSYDALGNLVQAENSNHDIFQYKYQNKKYPHLVTRIDYVSESKDGKAPSREISYDDNGLVASQRDRDGSVTNYTYGRSSSDPENNFWTKATHKGQGGSEEEYDEYLIKLRPDGTKFLYRQVSRRNGKEITTIFTPCCGKPSQVTKNGEVTNYKYDTAGLLLEKTNPKEMWKFEYDPRWKKVSRASLNGFVSEYSYDARGNLITASNSKKEKINLKYDRLGRIVEMTDPQGKLISFKYGAFNKPTQITDRTLGSVKINYDNDGRIAKTETIVLATKGRKPSEAESQEVIRKVMKSFQQLLEILKPAGVSATG